ncbi:hypothetical protein Dip510_001253 [Elusimicrobium posterum]|uniref:hypothetical protein n=1 Tax=Elusimicrobium posterum TaxID=3116653 RepID=UPI003C731B9D
MKKIILSLTVLFAANALYANLPMCADAVKDGAKHAQFKFDFDGNKKDEYFVLCEENGTVSAKVLNAKNKVLSSAAVQLPETKGLSYSAATNTNFNFGANKNIVVINAVTTGLSCRTESVTYLFYNKAKVLDSIYAPYLLGCPAESEETQLIFDTTTKSILVYETKQKNIMVNGRNLLEENTKKLTNIYTWDKNWDFAYPVTTEIK